MIEKNTIHFGVVFFDDETGSWMIEHFGKSYFIERWPSCKLYLGRDENWRRQFFIDDADKVHIVDIDE